MVLWESTGKLKRLTAGRLIAFGEAVCGTLVAWAMIRCTPYSFWRKWLGQPTALNDVPVQLSDPLTSADQVLIDISWAHSRLEVWARGFFTCLMVGLSARAALRRRGYSGILVLGAGKKMESSNSKLAAHAWVICDHVDIAGGKRRFSYKPVAAYSETKTSKVHCDG